MRTRFYNWVVFIIFLFVCGLALTAYHFRFALKLAGYYPTFAQKFQTKSDYLYRVKPSRKRVLILHGLDSAGNSNPALHQVALALADEKSVEVSLPLVKTLAGYKLNAAFADIKATIQKNLKESDELRIIAICVATPYVVQALSELNESEQQKLKAVFYFVPIYTGDQILKTSGSDYFSRYSRAMFVLRHSGNENLKNEIRDRFVTVPGFERAMSDDALDVQTAAFVNAWQGPRASYSYPTKNKMPHRSLVMCSTQDAFIPVKECRGLLQYLRKQSAPYPVLANFIDHAHGSLPDLIESLIVNYSKELRFVAAFFENDNKLQALPQNYDEN